MEAQLQRPTHEEDPRDHAGDGEKKSVLMKVKIKAKKIKDTIKKHSQGHDHDQISEEEDDGDEEMADPEVHAPMYESRVIPGTKLPIQTQVNLEPPTSVRDEGVTRPYGQAGTRMGTDSKARLAMPPVVEMEETIVSSEPTVQTRPLMGLEEDPHSPMNHPEGAPPSNYQSKVVYPTGQGGKEADAEPLVRRFDNLHVHSESESKSVPEQRSCTGNKDQFAPQPSPTKDQFALQPSPTKDQFSPESENPEQRSYTGSHDEFAPQPSPTKDQFAPQPSPTKDQFSPESENPELPKSCDYKKAESMPRDTIAQNIASATSAITDKAVSAKNAVVSKLGYGDSSKKPASGLGTEYAHKDTETQPGAGSAILTKVQGGGGAEHQGRDTTLEKETDKGVSMKEYLAKKLKPGEEDKALSEAITGAFHKKKEGVGKTPEDKPLARDVTPDEAVAQYLGTGKEDKREGEEAAPTAAGVGQRLKGTVSSWLGISPPTPQ